MINKNKVLLVTAIAAILLAGLGLLLMEGLLILSAKFVTIIYIAPVAISLYLSNQALKVICNVFVVQELKAQLIAQKKDIHLNLLNNQKLILIFLLLFPFILGFSFVIVYTDLVAAQYIVLFLFLFIQGWIANVYKYRYHNIYKRYLEKGGLRHQT